MLRDVHWHHLESAFFLKRLLHGNTDPSWRAYIKNIRDLDEAGLQNSLSFLL